MTPERYEGPTEGRWAPITALRRGVPPDLLAAYGDKYGYNEVALRRLKTETTPFLVADIPVKTEDGERVRCRVMHDFTGRVLVTTDAQTLVFEPGEAFYLDRAVQLAGEAAASG